MKHIKTLTIKYKRPPLPVIVVVGIVAVLIVYFIVRAVWPAGTPPLVASGTIEAVEVTISPEVGGKVVEVLVAEGASVKAGDVLLRLDGDLLRAQRELAVTTLNAAQAALQTAQATVESAQVQYDLVLDTALVKGSYARTAPWGWVGPANLDRPNWYFTLEEQITAAQTEIDTAEESLRLAEDRLSDIGQSEDGIEFMKAETRLIEAYTAYLAARDVNDRASHSSDAELLDAAQEAYDAARDELDTAQEEYDDLLEENVAEDILTARAEIAVARERYDAARERMLSLQTGAYSPQVLAAEAALKQAMAAASQAQAMVEQAQAQLDLIDVQIEKLSILAPMDGVILTRAIEPGEVVVPGAAVMILARLEDMTITVFVPEDRYGEISLGQEAEVVVDSFPDEVFAATVIHIADKAEFTPRNVQTVEGRKTTVFAIRLRVDDPERLLKPGMPADVTFIQNDSQ